MKNEELEAEPAEGETHTSVELNSSDTFRNESFFFFYESETFQQVCVGPMSYEQLRVKTFGF